jgi:hypothetical protein
MNNWFIRGGKKNCTSDGTIANQLGEKQGGPLMPMIPTHFLVIRNVAMSAEHWNSDGDTLSTWFSNTESSGHAHSSSGGGGVEVPVLGPVSLGASVSQSSSHQDSSFTDEGGNTFRSDFGSAFDRTTLNIKGAQIVAWLGEIVPACPPKDDPSLSH